MSGGASPQRKLIFSHRRWRVASANKVHPKYASKAYSEYIEYIEYTAVSIVFCDTAQLYLESEMVEFN